ncbi:ABC transporter, ATP-binding protein [Secundilactobacillus malefermentans DSM 5705 = KCTC 3548]|nr:ABC transporter, ATP-binding protein [Secundilactobacillus malefermentans DSM 5705 = KCTC 3548]
MRKMSSIEIKNVTKQFGKKEVLAGLNFKLEPNKIYGLLGRNGAGKSTLLSIMTNRIPLTSGTVTVDGESIQNNDKILQKMYLMSEVSLYNSRLRVFQVFNETDKMYGKFDFDLANRLAGEFGLDLNARIGKLSTGYRTIFKVLVAMGVSAEYIFLDEPTLGLDANHRDLFYKELMESYANRPRTFVISTHLIEEVANLVEHVLIIKNGKILIDSGVDETLAKAHTVTGPEADVDSYTAGLNVIGHDSLGKIKANYVFGDMDDKILPDTVSIESMDLQKLFINLTNEGEN